MSKPLEEVLSINAAFYEALATGDFGLMQKVWSNTDEVTCIHPGWGSIFGRQSVMRSWETILQSPPQIACNEPEGSSVGILPMSLRTRIWATADSLPPTFFG